MLKYVLVLIAVYFLHCEGAVIIKNEELNHRPIIGVLSQELSSQLNTKFPEENYTSYIAASYVKDIEKSGARVVPIFIGKDRSYYKHLMGKINGVLFPGGAALFSQSNGYADAGQYILEIAKEMNDAGEYFPIHGTCLGFQLIVVIASGRGKKENIESCWSFQNLPLNFTKDYRKSKMFRETPEDHLDILKNKDVTINYHHFCVLDKNLRLHNLTEDWHVTSHSRDQHGVEFIASLEHKRYPFYGTQFHPEKSSYEWMLSRKHLHTYDAIKANRYFMDFFVSECRRSLHSFANQSEENKYLIYNYEPRFTGALGSIFVQCYFFEPKGKVYT